MKIGLDVFTIRELNLDSFGQLDYARNHNFDGVQFDDLYSMTDTLDIGKLKAIKSYADELGLYSYVSISACNPNYHNDTAENVTARLAKEIEDVAKAGWHELRSIIGGVDERYSHPVPWPKHIEDSMRVIEKLRPILRENASRINLETHGDTTTFELIRMIETVGPDILGINLDTANVLVHAEDPVAAAKRAAPYTHLTHAKDGIVFLSERGIVRQGRPPGQGVIEWEKVLPVLAYFSPDLPLSIEDHKWLFEIPVFDEQWNMTHREIPANEITNLIKRAIGFQKKIDNGDLPKPDAYEAIPYLEQMEERLCSGRDYLAGLLKKTGL